MIPLDDFVEPPEPTDEELAAMTPKLSSLTPEQKTRLLAELDGWHSFTQRDYGRIVIFGKHATEASFEVPDYLISYDAIIPLVQKLWKSKTDKFINGLIFDEVLRQMLKEHYNGSEGWHHIATLYATPSQLCDAVLVATGKAEL